MVNGEFVFPLAQAMLKQPGDLRPKEEEKIRRRREQRKKREEDEKKAAELPQEELQQPDADIPSSAQDFWTCNKDCLIRHHRQPRVSLYMPTEKESPLPLKY